MAAHDGGIPTNLEVERQLERMLESKRLKASPNRAMLLEYVAKKRIAHEEISEDIIGYDLFPGYAADESNNVRVTANHLRDTLSLYYAEEGADDLVRVELPPGAKYRPVFTYNPRSAANKAYSRGQIALSQFRLLNAGDCFKEAIHLQPAYAEAHVGLAEVELLTPLCPSDISVSKGRRHVRTNAPASGTLPSARRALDNALRVNPDLAQAHVLSGVAHSYEYAWEKAEKSFSAALELAPNETRRNLWYLSYLITRNRSDEALPILTAKINEAPDASTLTLYGFVMYLRRDYPEAKRAFEDACNANPHYWPAFIGNACAALAYVGSDDALFALGDIADSFPKGLFFPGFVVCCLAMYGRIEEAKDRFMHYAMGAPVSDVDRALGYMGLGDTAKAVEELTSAYEERDPLMLWLHLWPLFDPLRGDPTFEALISRMNLPKQG